MLPPWYSGFKTPTMAITEHTLGPHTGTLRLHPYTHIAHLRRLGCCHHGIVGSKRRGLRPLSTYTHGLHTFTIQIHPITCIAHQVCLGHQRQRGRVGSKRQRLLPHPSQIRSCAEYHRAVGGLNAGKKRLDTSRIQAKALRVARPCACCHRAVGGLNAGKKRLDTSRIQAKALRVMRACACCH